MLIDWLPGITSTYVFILLINVLFDRYYYSWKIRCETSSYFKISITF
jgi:hypothetical protein